MNHLATGGAASPLLRGLAPQPVQTHLNIPVAARGRTARWPQTTLSRKKTRVRQDRVKNFCPVRVAPGPLSCRGAAPPGGGRSPHRHAPPRPRIPQLLLATPAPSLRRLGQRAGAAALARARAPRSLPQLGLAG